jgi:hypothetical protein
MPITEATSPSRSVGKLTSDDQKRIRRVLGTMGIPESYDGGFDFARLVKLCEFSENKSINDVRHYVENVLTSKDSDKDVHQGPAISRNSVLRRRIHTMAMVRAFMKDEAATHRAIVELGQWGYLKGLWTADFELQYWRDLLELGIGGVEETLRNRATDAAASGNSLLKLSTDKVERRAETLFERIADRKPGSKSKSRSKSKPKQNQVKAKSKYAPSPHLDQPTPVRGSSALPALETGEHSSTKPADNAPIVATKIGDITVICPMKLRRKPGCWVLSFGMIDPEVKQCWCEEYMYPIGYKIKRPWSSGSDSKEDWIGEITCSDGHLVFTVWPENDHSLRYVGSTSIDAFCLSRIDKKKAGLIGTDLWLLKDPDVAKILHQMAIAAGVKVKEEVPVRTGGKVKEEKPVKASVKTKEGKRVKPSVKAKEDKQVKPSVKAKERKPVKTGVKVTEEVSANTSVKVKEELAVKTSLKMKEGGGDLLVTVGEGKSENEGEGLGRARGAMRTRSSSVEEKSSGSKQKE